VSTKANVPQFWDEMNGLMLMNRRILQQKRSNENARQNITTSSPTSGERSTSESHQAVVTAIHRFRISPSLHDVHFVVVEILISNLPE
jgi:hypothetical protein